MSQYSNQRLSVRIKEIISSLILTGAIKNPNLSTLVSITDVILAKDNANCTVYVSSVLENDKSFEKSVKALNSASPFIQSRINSVLKLRNTPILLFKEDKSFKEGERISEIIDKAMKEIKSNE